MRNRRFHQTVTESELGFWDAEDGELVLSIPLPVVAIAKTKAYINSYNIKGVWMKDPPKQWGPDPMDVDTWGENLIGFDLSRRG